MFVLTHYSHVFFYLDIYFQIWRVSSSPSARSDRSVWRKIGICRPRPIDERRKRTMDRTARTWIIWMRMSTHQTRREIGYSRVRWITTDPSRSRSPTERASNRLTIPSGCWGSWTWTVPCYRPGTRSRGSPGSPPSSRSEFKDVRSSR